MNLRPFKIAITSNHTSQKQMSGLLDTSEKPSLVEGDNFGMEGAGKDLLKNWRRKGFKESMLIRRRTKLFGHS